MRLSLPATISRESFFRPSPAPASWGGRGYRMFVLYVYVLSASERSINLCNRDGSVKGDTEYSANIAARRAVFQ